MKYSITLSHLKFILNESSTNDKIIFAKQYQLVNKVNAEINDAIKLCGPDSVYLDNSSTIVSIPCAITPIEVTIDNDASGKPVFIASWQEEDNTSFFHGNKKMNTEQVSARLWQDEDTGKWYINDDNFKDQMKYILKCVRKAVKYFKEVTPDTDEEKWNDENSD